MLPSPDKPIIIATAQSRIAVDVHENGNEIRSLMRLARERGADLVHFPEGAMSGYTKSQIKNWDDVDWPALHEELECTARLAAELEVWTVMGCCHRLTAPHRPHNSMYVISASGTLETRYDKQWCSHTEITRFFSPGQGLCVFEVNGWRFGCALCIEIQFPELFLAYSAQRVDCVLFSSYSEVPMYGIQAQGYAASHNYWFSMSVPAQMSHAMSARLVAPDGTIQSACEPGVSTLIVNELNAAAPEWTVPLQHAKPWREKAREGSIYHAAHVSDPRSSEKSRF